MIFRRTIIYLPATICVAVFASQLFATKQTITPGNSMPKRTRSLLNSTKESGSPIGGVVMLSLSRSDTAKGKAKSRNGTNGANRLAAAFQLAGLALLRVQLPVSRGARGRTKSGEAAVEAAVKLAVEQLSAKCGENRDRIAILAEDETADAAVLGARAEWQVRSFVLLSGRLSPRAKELLAEWSDNPTFCLVSSEDKTALRDMTDVYFSSRNADSDIQVLEGMGSGTKLFESWAIQFPQREPLEQTIAGWVHRELSSVGREREVSFMTEDGWKIFANLLLPDLEGKLAPGVILLHSGRSDRYVFTNLERLLGRAGFAVLNIDWRGRGKSVGKGKYFDLSKEERANGKLDAKAAIDFLTSQSGVDTNRVGLVGIIHGAEHAVAASVGDLRVKALAILHGYVPASDEERAYLTSGQVHVMYVTSRAHKQVTETMRGLYEATPDKLTRFLVFEGGAIGYQLFELDDNFEPTIVGWLEEGLAQRDKRK